MARSFCWIVVALICCVPRPVLSADAKDVFHPLVFTRGEETLPYRLMSPRGFDPDAPTKFPLVVFLHGAGERGDDNVAQLVHAMNDFANDQNRERYPCFVVAPQCPKDLRWVETDWTAPSHEMPIEPSRPMSLLLDLIPFLQKQYPIDEKRIYATGLSMGGFGTWDLLARRPEWFAAAAPVCGGADESTAGRLAKIPLWTFHGDRDTVVVPSRSRNMVAALKRAGGNIRYTEYEGIAHNSWVKAYSDPELMAWLFSQRKE